MAAPFLDDLRDLLGALPAGATGDGAAIMCKHFFSGAAAYVAGQIFMSLSPAGLALKLPPEQCRRLRGEGATQLQYFSGSPIKKDYVVLPEGLATGKDALAALVTEAIQFAQDHSTARDKT